MVLVVESRCDKYIIVAILRCKYTQELFYTLYKSSPSVVDIDHTGVHILPSRGQLKAVPGMVLSFIRCHSLERFQLGKCNFCCKGVFLCMQNREIVYMDEG